MVCRWTSINLTLKVVKLRIKDHNSSKEIEIELINYEVWKIVLFFYDFFFEIVCTCIDLCSPIKFL